MHRAAGRGVLVIDDDQVVAVVPVQLVLLAGQLHERDRGLGHQRVQRLAAQPALEAIRAEQPAQFGSDLLVLAVGLDLLIEPGRLRAVAADPVQVSPGPSEVVGDLAQRLGRVGHPGDAAFG